MEERRLFHEESEKTQLVFAEGFVKSVFDDLNDIKHSFFRIGFRLHEASRMGYYKTLGYANITDLALDKFNFSKSSTYELIGIYEFAHGDAPLLMAPQYDKFSQSQLRELCRLKYDSPGFMRIVKPSDKVADIGKAVTFWNKYVARHSGGPGVDNISDLLMLDISTLARDAQRYLQRLKSEHSEDKNSAYAEKSEYQSTPQGQLPGQIGFNLSEPEPAENSAYAENYGIKEHDKLMKELDALITGTPNLSDADLAEYCLIEGRCFDKFEACYKIQTDDEFARFEFPNYIKAEYGTGGWSGDKVYQGVTTSYKGFEIKRHGGGKLVLSWSIVAGRIKRLIETGKYLTAAEQEEYQHWKAKREAPKVELAPDEEFFQRHDDSELIEAKPAETETPPAVPETITAKTETNREYLASLPTEELVQELLIKIIQNYPFKSSSPIFVSTMRPCLIEWLNAEKGALK